MHLEFDESLVLALGWWLVIVLIAIAWLRALYRIADGVDRLASAEEERNMVLETDILARRKAWQDEQAKQDERWEAIVRERPIGEMAGAPDV